MLHPMQRLSRASEEPVREEKCSSATRRVITEPRHLERSAGRRAWRKAGPRSTTRRHRSKTRDVLEIVNHGLVKYTVVDRYLATFSGVRCHADMKVREDVVLREGADIAFAIRKATHRSSRASSMRSSRTRRGTTSFGNVVIRRYLQDTRSGSKNSLANAEREKLVKVAQLFQKYGDRCSIGWR